MTICEGYSSLDRSYRRVALTLRVANASGRGNNINLVSLRFREVGDVIGRGLCLAARRLNPLTEIERISTEIAEQVNTIRASSVLDQFILALAAIDGAAKSRARITGAAISITAAFVPFGVR